ncbi:MAG: exodeoxyribonuclease V subunit beta [Pseudomonadales bacterium]
MTAQVIPLQPISMPLHGLALIEASAGTGKTYTLAALYLRLLLGHECPRALDVKEILVVTFTEAATQELRERIRKRIQEARAAFIAGSSDDPFIVQLLAAQLDRERAILDLEFAASEMDQAAIFTIHGFCQRMLKQHAFESGANFEAELISDDSAVVRTALLDYWRAELYSATPELASEILSCYATPDALLTQIRSYLGLEGLVLQPDLTNLDLSASWEAFSERQSSLRTALLAITDSSEDIVDLVLSSGVNKSSYKKNLVPKWWLKVLDFASGENAPWKELERFRSSVLREKTKSGAAPEHALFEAIESLCECRVAVREAVFCRALSAVRTNMAQHKERLQQLSFDDLLAKLERALGASNSESLRAAIRKQYPFALIDEFQDTDPQQYQIFSSLYRDTGSDDLALLMIGDPKQSIYAFRGADIFTYMRARREVAQHFTLETNWRSSPSMIAATNTLFSRANAPFIYDEDIPFYPVKAAEKPHKVLQIGGRECAAMNLWCPSEPVTGDQYLSESARDCARHIEQVLERASIGEEALTPSSVAVLVRDRKEASLVQQALSALAIDSVFMSNRDNVFTTALATALQYLLQAVEQPNNERLMRSALASDIFCYSALELFELNQDEVAWERLVDEFAEYRQTWQRSGVLAMLHTLLQRRTLAQRWFGDLDGERKLTDFLHLGELLQQASVELESSEALLRWLSERRLQPNGQNQEQQLRLDSDRARVTVITIHKSKGLEYDLVYLPFVCRYRQSKGMLYHREDGRSVIDLSAKEHRAQIEKEQLAEDLRLLYVAVTRAAHACFIGMAQVQSRGKDVWQRTAIGYLLTQQEEGAEELGCVEALEQLEQASPAIALIQLGASGVQQEDLFAQPQTATLPSLAARAFTRELDRDWRVTSYSALSRDIEHAPAFSSAKLDIEVLQEQSEQPALEEEEPELSIFTFPKGALAGTFLHSIYEELEIWYDNSFS